MQELQQTVSDASLSPPPLSGPSPGSSCPLRRIEKPQLLSSGPRRVGPLLMGLHREGPGLQTQPRPTGAGGRGPWPEPQRGSVRSSHQVLAAPRPPPDTGSRSSNPLACWVTSRRTAWSLRALSVNREAQRETDVPSGAWLPRKPWTRDRSPPELKLKALPSRPVPGKGAS